MATWNDVRRLALGLPETTEDTSFGSVAWKVKKKGFVWERPLRKSDIIALGSSAPKGAVLGVRTADIETKEAMLAANPDIYFTTPHFDGYPAVLVRLAKIGVGELRDVVIEAWLARAPEKLAAAFLAERMSGRRLRGARGFGTLRRRK